MPPVIPCDSWAGRAFFRIHRLLRLDYSSFATRSQANSISSTGTIELQTTYYPGVIIAVSTSVMSPSGQYVTQVYT
jgi:hypothetical protein